MDSNRKSLMMTTTAQDGTLLVAGDLDMAGGPILEQAMVEREAELAAAEGGDLTASKESALGRRFGRACGSKSRDAGRPC